MLGSWEGHYPNIENLPNASGVWAERLAFLMCVSVHVGVRLHAL